MEAQEKVLETLAKSEKPLKGKEIAELSGLDKKDVDKAIKVLKANDKVYSPKNCFYDVKA